MRKHSATRARAIALPALLTALALALSLLESAIPLGLVVPIPGIKLGLSNVVTLFALFSLGAGPALAILLCRIALLYLMSGSFTSLLMSLSGGLFAFAAMALAKRLYPRAFSLYGVSVAGAGAHSLGQIAMAALLTRSPDIFFYLALLLLTSIVSGTLTGAAAFGALRAFTRKDQF